MILVRNVFKVRFGKAKEAMQAWKEVLALAKKLGFASKSNRLMTDLVGDFYTVVFENEFSSLTDFENGSKGIMANPEWQAAYAKIVALTDSGYREIFNIIE
jgi:hypothetical protein